MSYRSHNNSVFLYLQPFIGGRLGSRGKQECCPIERYVQARNIDGLTFYQPREVYYD